MTVSRASSSARPRRRANLGPGFDCAGAALDLWNELHVEPADVGAPLVTLEGEGADELPRRRDAPRAPRVRAASRRSRRFSFRFVNRIPLERGLGSSRRDVAAGLVAGRVAAGRDASLDELLELGLPLEGHADNLAPALERRRLPHLARRRAARRTRGSPSTLPLDADRRRARGAREHAGPRAARLPETLTHEEAAAAAAQAALLGAAIAGGDAGAARGRLPRPPARAVPARRRAAPRAAARAPGRRAPPA